MFAGVLAARAGAFYGEIREVHPYLVDGAAPALAPDGVVGAAGALPGFRNAQLPASGGDLGVWRERRDALGVMPALTRSPTA